MELVVDDQIAKSLREKQDKYFNSLGSFAKVGLKRGPDDGTSTEADAAKKMRVLPAVPTFQ